MWTDEKFVLCSYRGSFLCWKRLYFLLPTHSLLIVSPLPVAPAHRYRMADKVRALSVRETILPTFLSFTGAVSTCLYVLERLTCPYRRRILFRPPEHSSTSIHLPYSHRRTVTVFEPVEARAAKLVFTVWLTHDEWPPRPSAWLPARAENREREREVHLKECSLIAASIRVMIRPQRCFLCCVSLI